MPGRRHPRSVVAALAWLGAATIAGTVAWNAVAVLSHDSARTGLLSESEVAAALADARATTTPGTSATDSPAPTARATGSPEPITGPTPTGAPSAAPSTDPGPVPAGSPTAVAATWQLTGGTVSVECTATRISLLFATPDDGWTVEVGSRGPEKVEVELHRSEDETKITAECSDGTPTRTVETRGEEHSEDE
ncbi:hypothetical protein [Actinotalea sp.]|uniref:hypothetical protein n=1 Tax=Actinotalea sp. TaxID=1872145 RepID=UPI00356776FA